MSESDWHLEEKLVKVSGKPRYMWTAIDKDGEVLDFCLTETRDREAALATLQRLMKQHSVLEARMAKSARVSRVKAR